MHYHHQEQGQKEEWDSVWAQKGIGTTIINTGREVYNFFFRRFLSRYITADTEMAEFGSGTATLSLSMTHRMKHYTGFDYSDEAIVLAQSNAKKYKAANAIFLKHNVLEYNQHFAEKFDIVWSQGLIEHFDAYEPIIKAHWGMTKPRGVVLISVPYKYSYHFLWFVLTRPKYLRKFWPFADQTRFLTRSDLKEQGLKLSSSPKVMFLPPSPLGFLLGIVILEIKKPLE